MPYKLEWESSGVIFRYSGVVSDEDLKASNAEVYASPLLSELRYQIVDFSGMKRYKVESATLREVAQLDEVAARSNPNLKIAVVSSLPLIRGMSSIYRHTHEGTGGTWETELFESEAEPLSRQALQLSGWREFGLPGEICRKCRSSRSLSCS